MKSVFTAQLAVDYYSSGEQKVQISEIGHYHPNHLPAMTKSREFWSGENELEKKMILLLRENVLSTKSNLISFSSPPTAAACSFVFSVNYTRQ